MSMEPATGNEWAILNVDPLTGDLIDGEERAYRERIRQEADQGLFGVDAFYFSVKRAIHQPLIGEHGEVAEDAWQIERANKIVLRVPIGDDPVTGRIQEAAVNIARTALDDFAAEVMEMLFSIANDPPNWRRREFTVHLSGLLDRLGFKRDSRGVHRSDARRKLSTTLLGLHLTHVGVQRKGGRRGGTVGFIAPLIGSIVYATKEDTGALSPLEVFRAGLPEEIGLSINPLWYHGLRQDDGSAGKNYTLIPRPQSLPRNDRPRAARSRTTEYVREYVVRCQGASAHPYLQITLRMLLEVATVRDSNPRQAARTLQRALEQLCDEATLSDYGPKPLPTSASDLVTLHWTTP